MYPYIREEWIACTVVFTQNQHLIISDGENRLKCMTVCHVAMLLRCSQVTATGKWPIWHPIQKSYQPVDFHQPSAMRWYVCTSGKVLSHFQSNPAVQLPIQAFDWSRLQYFNNSFRNSQIKLRKWLSRMNHSKCNPACLQTSLDSPYHH